MIGLVRMLGFVVVILGAIYVWKPETIKNMIKFWLKGKRIYVGGIINIFFSIIFLLVALKCRMPLIIAILGILSLIKGIVIFLHGPQAIAKKLSKFMNLSINGLRFLGVLTVIMGVLIIFSA